MRIYGPRSAGTDLREPFLAFSFLRHSLFGRPSGGHIFLCLKKDMEERQTKGLQSRPLESCFYTGAWRGDVRRPYEFAQMHLTRFRPVRGVLRTVSTDSIVLLQLRRIRNTYRITGLICGRQSGGFGCAFVFWGTQKPSQRGRCRRMSAEEGMRGELTVEEPTETAGNLAFYASSVSTSAATFPMGEGLDRRNLNVA